MEPKTMESLQKIQELAKNIYKCYSNKYCGAVLTGFEKHDDAGTDVRHNSDGSRALIKPWPGTGRITDSGQPHLRFKTQSNRWQDGDADGNIGDGTYLSICESY